MQQEPILRGRPLLFGAAGVAALLAGATATSWTWLRRRARRAKAAALGVAFGDTPWIPDEARNALRKRDKDERDRQRRP